MRQHAEHGPPAAPHVTAGRVLLGLPLGLGLGQLRDRRRLVHHSPDRSRVTRAFARIPVSASPPPAGCATL